MHIFLVLFIPLCSAVDAAAMRLEGLTQTDDGRFDLCAPGLRILKRPHNDSTVSQSAAASLRFVLGTVGNGDEAERMQGEASRNALSAAPTQALPYGTGAQQCTTERTIHFNISPVVGVLRTRQLFVQRGHTVLTSRVLRLHMQPPKSAATATLRGRAKVSVQTGRELLHGAAARYTKHTRKRSSSTSSSTSTGSSCSRAHPHSGLGLGRADDDEPIKNFLITQWKQL